MCPVIKASGTSEIVISFGPDSRLRFRPDSVRNPGLRAIRVYGGLTAPVCSVETLVTAPFPSSALISFGNVNSKCPSESVIVPNRSSGDYTSACPTASWVTRFTTVTVNALILGGELLPGR